VGADWLSATDGATPVAVAEQARLTAAWLD
jgi:hypothetical protein